MGWQCGCSGQSGAVYEEVRGPRGRCRAYCGDLRAPARRAREEEGQMFLTTREYQARDRLGSHGRILGRVCETIRLFTEMISRTA